jgi:hypothetical protein
LYDECAPGAPSCYVGAHGEVNTEVAQAEPSLLTPKQVMARTGLTRYATYNLIKAGIIPAIDISARALKRKRGHRPTYRVPREALEKWLSAQVKK